MLDFFPLVFPVFKFGGFHLFPTYCWSLVTLRRGTVLTAVRGTCVRTQVVLSAQR